MPPCPSLVISAGGRSVARTTTATPKQLTLDARPYIWHSCPSQIGIGLFRVPEKDQPYH